MTHTCPAPGCSARVPREQLACRGHWFSLPKDLRNEIWRTYRSGEHDDHTALIASAIAILRDQATVQADG